MMILPGLKNPSELKKLNFSQLKTLSEELRQEIIAVVSKNGGHLASNLGVIELTVALHHRLNCPEDRIVWDVSHQTYAHKLLTGRFSDFCSLRTYGGLSGYASISESPYDCFGAGHSSTSLSAALGMAISRDLLGKKHEIVAVIGDGAMTGGMAWEALNHIGALQKRMIIILNDNTMSISENVGAFSNYLSLLRSGPGYAKAKKKVKDVLREIPIVGKPLSEIVSRVKETVKYTFVEGLIFEEMGLTYLGPIDGHDLKLLDEVLEHALRLNGPVLIHCLTRKGKGYPPAEESPDRFHGVSSFDIDTGESPKSKTATYSHLFGHVITRLAEKDSRITAITAAMSQGVGLTEFRERFPDRFFDTGIAEQHAVTLAGGMAQSGMKPVFAVYSTFLQRAYDQILHDIALQNLPVVFAIDRGGLVGDDGATHHGVFDLSYLHSIPNMTIMAPADGVEMQLMLPFALSLNSPVALRYPRSKIWHSEDILHPPIELGAPIIVRKGKDIVIWAIGRMVKNALEAAEVLMNRGINASVVNSRFLKPLSPELLRTIAETHQFIFTMEDNSVLGGLGDAIMNMINDENLNLKLHKLGIPDRFVSHGKIHELDQELGLDAEAVANFIQQIIIED